MNITLPRVLGLSAVVLIGNIIITTSASAFWGGNNPWGNNNGWGNQSQTGFGPVDAMMNGDFDFDVKFKMNTNWDGDFFGNGYQNGYYNQYQYPVAGYPAAISAPAVAAEK